jgi:sodium-dependent phosphate cotransporter
VQSSTITTSLIVTIVATGKVSVKKAFPFILGANIGTTITAAIAAIYQTEAAISIALVHFLFNFIGALIFLPFPAVRNIPVQLATLFGEKTVKSRLIGLAYILLTFFIIPFLLIYFNRG